MAVNMPQQFSIYTIKSFQLCTNYHFIDRGPVYGSLSQPGIFRDGSFLISRQKAFRPWASIWTSSPLGIFRDGAFLKGYQVPISFQVTSQLNSGAFSAQESKKNATQLNLLKNTKNVRIKNHIIFIGFLGSRNQVKILFW